MPQFSSEARFKVHCFFSSTELLGGSSTLNKVYLDLLNGADSSLQHCLKLEVGNGKFPQGTLRLVSKVFLFYNFLVSLRVIWVERREFSFIFWSAVTWRNNPWGRQLPSHFRCAPDEQMTDTTSSSLIKLKTEPGNGETLLNEKL